MAGFLGKTPGAWTTVESADQCKLMNGHCDLWKTPPWESRGCSQILFFVHFIPPSAFSRLLPGQRCFAALSSEWLNNSGESDFSCTSLGLCLWSNTTQGLDTLKTPLRIWLCTQKRMEKSGSGRSRQWMMALMFSPKHLMFAVKRSSEWRQAIKLPSNNLAQGYKVIFSL